MTILLKTKLSVPVEYTKEGARADYAKQTRDGGAQAARALNQFTLQPGILIPGVVFTVGTNAVIMHTLQRVPNGWFLVSARAYISGAATCAQEVSRDVNNLTLGPFANFTADVWIF